VTAASIFATGLVLASLLSDADALRAARIFGIALVALSLIPLTGFAGQVSLCQMSFAAIGALVMAHHGHDGSPWGLVLAAVVSGLTGAIVALPALRLSGLYLALATAAFAVFLDRWIFLFPSFDIGSVHIAIFEGGVVPVSPLRLPGLDPHDKGSQLVVLAGSVALSYLLVVAVRRSGFGQRLLAMKDSPAACATLGLDLTRLKLAAFALSAAMAGVGGALYAGTVGSISPERFNLFESLALLLLTVVGGITSASGAVFAGVILGGFPIAIGIWPFLENLNRLLPGTMGVTLGRNPNGAVQDVGRSAQLVGTVRWALAGLVVSAATAILLALTGAISGWGLTFVLVATLTVWPGAAQWWAARPVTDSAPSHGSLDEVALEWAGLELPLTLAQLEEVDAALGVDIPALGTRA
jgi:branched-chain amino acid transport system permease protein